MGELGYGVYRGGHWEVIILVKSFRKEEWEWGNFVVGKVGWKCR
jgi:hypothetical protein